MAVFGSSNSEVVVTGTLLAGQVAGISSRSSFWWVESPFEKSRVKVEGNFVQMFPVCKDAKEVFEVAFAWCSLVLRED